jgi:hypothetical protein
MNYRLLSLLACLAGVLGCVTARHADAVRPDLYVATNGNDVWSGRLAVANADRSDGPLATVQGARDKLRAWRKTDGPAHPRVVQVQGGTYVLEQAIDFSAKDSGTAAAPVVYRAEPGAIVRLTGGRAVSSWRVVDDPAVLARLPAEVRGQVQVADLRAQGITDFGKLSVRGFGAGNPAAEAELFQDDEPMTLARWPNEGFQKVVSAQDPLVIVTDAERVARWAQESAPWVFAYWHHDWAELYEPLQGIQATNNALLRTQSIKPVFGITAKAARWYAFNLLSEIDRPGEYYLDRTNGLLYFLPPHPGGRTVLSMVESIIRAENLAHVTFRGFVMEACRGTAFSLKGGTNCAVVGCTIRNTGHNGVVVTGGVGHTVYGCDVSQTGTGGIAMSGGNRRMLTAAGHNAENNHVCHFGRRARTYQPGIRVDGVGNRIAHNLVHDGPHMALAAGGNDHVVEFNEIHNVVEESGDAGAYYVGRDWTQRGNVLRYNYWHQIVGGTGYGGMTIYLDDQHCGHTIQGNIFERCSQAVFIGGGDDNVVTNNVFIGCWRAAHLDNRGMNWQKKATDDPKAELRSGLRAMPYQNELWSARYPELVRILEDDPGIPKRNVFARNISAGGVWDDISKSIRTFQTVTNNLVFDGDPTWVQLIKDANGCPVRLEFKNPAAVQALGFVPVPVEQMGLYQDPRRASWPVEHTVRFVKLPEAKPKK